MSPASSSTSSSASNWLAVDRPRGLEGLVWRFRPDTESSFRSRESRVSFATARVVFALTHSATLVVWSRAVVF